MTVAVAFEDVSKVYGSGGPSYASLRYDLAQLGRKVAALSRGPAVKATGHHALDGVSFEVNEGDAFALIGPNGAGKTTALKLLARISYPTGGRVRLRGRVGALIEVGSGIHPELSGRENIWLYGRIMGMSKREIQRRFDEIVEFAELSNVLDRPVKMYSSGMQLRLGFAIASHIDPDIFVVDEALAVGDARFQAKCAKRMSSFVSEGRTLLFVSHNLPIVEAICNRGIFLLDGRVRAVGATRDILRTYLDWIDEGQQHSKSFNSGAQGRDVAVERVTLHDRHGCERYVFGTNEAVEVRLHVYVEHSIERPWFSLWISDGRPGALILCSMLDRDDVFYLPRGRHVVSCRLEALPLRPRTYELGLAIREGSGGVDLLHAPSAAILRIRLPEDAKGIAGVTAPWVYSPVFVEHAWNIMDHGSSS